VRDFFVVSTPPAKDERFALVWREDIRLRPFDASKSPEERGHAFADVLRTKTFVSEDRIRRQLADMGLPSDDVEDQIERARRMHTDRVPTTWERTTRIGFRNEHGQEVNQDGRPRGSAGPARVHPTLRRLR
jgi:hypothetical protein